MKRSLVFVLSLLALAGLFFATTLVDEPLQFADPQLEAALREELGQEVKPIFRSQMLNLVTLDLSGRGITDLSGLEGCRNLRVLNLADNQVLDLSPLAGLSNLRELNLANNPITKLEEANLGLLAGIPLRSMDLSFNRVTREDRTLLSPDDISLLAGFRTLEVLRLAGNQVERADGLAGLTNLRELDLQGNQLSDISFLEDLTLLEKLNLAGNQVPDITVLRRLGKLRTLDLQANVITDITALGGLVLLEELNLAENQVSDLSPLRDALRLRELDLMGNLVGDISVLADHLKLVKLDLSGNQVRDIQALAGLRDLRELNLRDNQVSDIAPLQGLATLEKLNLRGNALRDIRALASLEELTYLNLHSNEQITDLSPLARLANLQELILRNVRVGEQVEVLSGLNQLWRLNLRNCGIRDLAALEVLMREGSLRDDPERGISALVDLRDNPLPKDPQVYAPILPYWHKIHVRYPLELPAYALQAPEFSHPSGFYAESFSLSMQTVDKGVRIYYTIDGSIPTKQSHLYSVPLSIKSREGFPNTFSLIPTNSSDWVEPEGKVAKAFLIRARAIDAYGRAYSPVVTGTYFVGEDMLGRYSLPVVSLVSDPAFLFDPQIGIYIEQNYEKRGEKWERPAYFEYFEPDGSLGYAKETDIRLNGEWTRNYAQKSLRLYADVDYGEGDTFMYDFFKSQDPPQNLEAGYDVLILRNGGQDWRRAMMRDALVQGLAAQIGLDTQAQKPVVVFLNGEYWGVHYLVERYDAGYFVQHYGVDAQDLAVLEYEGVLRIGEEAQADAYNEMLNYLKGQSPLDQAVYQELNAWMDMDNYIDYQILQLFAANSDWPGNNIAYWRVTNPQAGAEGALDGRWRWLVQDTDSAFFYTDYDAIRQAQVLDKGGFLFGWLLQNPGFQAQFLTRLADLMNSVFLPTHVMAEIDAREASLAPEMTEHIQRWQTVERSLANWFEQVQLLREFANARPQVLRQQLVDYFGLAGTFTLGVEAEQAMGYVRVNSLDLRAGSPGVENPGAWAGVYFLGQKLQVSAVPLPGYRFSHWEGLDGQTDPSLSLQPDADLTLRAVFAPQD